MTICHLNGENHRWRPVADSGMSWCSNCGSLGHRRLDTGEMEWTTPSRGRRPSTSFLSPNEHQDPEASVAVEAGGKLRIGILMRGFPLTPQDIVPYYAALFPAVLSNARDGSLPPVYPMVAADGIAMTDTRKELFTPWSTFGVTAAEFLALLKKRLDAR